MTTKDVLIQIIKAQKETALKLKYNNDALCSLSGLVNIYQRNSLKPDKINGEMVDLFINYLLDEINGEESELLNQIDNILNLIIN